MEKYLNKISILYINSEFPKMCFKRPNYDTTFAKVPTKAVPIVFQIKMQKTKRSLANIFTKDEYLMNMPMLYLSKCTEAELQCVLL